MERQTCWVVDVLWKQNQDVSRLLFMFASRVEGNALLGLFFPK